MVKDVGGYLLTASINGKFIVKVTPFFPSKTIDMEDYTKPTKRDFNPDLYILHVETNNLSLDDTTEVISNRIIDTAKSLMTEKNKIIIPNIAPRGEDISESSHNFENDPNNIKMQSLLKISMLMLYLNEEIPR